MQFHLLLGLVRRQRGKDLQNLEEVFHNSHLIKDQSHTIVLSVFIDGNTLVDTYSGEDLADTQNWSSKKKVFVAMHIWYAFKFPSAESQLLY